MEGKTYETSDLGLAAYLYCAGVQLTEIERQNPRRCIFIFDSPKPELVSKWQEGKASVNALAFLNSYQVLKRRLYSRDG